MNRPYGMELILDLHGCNPILFTRDHIDAFMAGLCSTIKMERCDLHFWDDVDVPEEDKQTNPHTKGTSAVQFILTSNVTIHTLDELQAVYLNIFSCKRFDADVAAGFCVGAFGGSVVNKIVVDRQ